MNKNQSVNSTRWTQAKVTPLYPATPDARGFFESVLGFMDGLADVWFRVSAADQKRYFGKVLFGKCSVKVSETGVVKIIKSKAYGHDQDSMEMYFDHNAKTFRTTYSNTEVSNPAWSL